MSTIIEVKDIRRAFRSPKKEEGMKGTMKLLFKPEFSEHEALKGVNFKIEQGSFVGLIGANGAGKTTLLKILSGLIPPTSGSARVLGIDPFDRPMNFRHQISLVMGQKAQLWWDLPAVDAFDLLKAIYEIPEKTYRERLNTLTELLDVTKHLNTQIRRLSLGERMKMELIGALLHWPKVIFLDEPTIGLDVLAAAKLREFLRVFNQREKVTIILTSHNMDDIERLCSRVLILRNGEMIFDGQPSKLIQQGACRLRVRLKEEIPAAKLSQWTGLAESAIEIAEPEADDEGDAGDIKTIYFETKQEAVVTVLQALMKNCSIIDMGVEEPSLESVIQRIYSDPKA
ncbi:MAG: ATP-binding cassette domain-containing protein [Bdellovibrionales bacterium]|nr:ATP-binding cassette domain-containing protein [Bdellovibrionales bacterium]